MKERIREFSDLASSYAGNYEVGSPMWMNFYNEKFAELIVKECVTTLEFHGFDDTVPYIRWMATNRLGVK